MQAVILAGGRGIRMGDLCKNCPKPLIQIGSKPIIVRTLETLPESINDIVIVVGYMGKYINSFLGDYFRGIKITYVIQEITGTGGALIAAKDMLKDIFFVVNGDDLYRKGELESFGTDRAKYGITYGVPNQAIPENICFNEEGLFLGREPSAPNNIRWFGVGAYLLQKDIFSGTWHTLPSGELSIPHSLVNQKFPIYVQPVKYWLPVNTPEQLERAKLAIADW